MERRPYPSLNVLNSEPFHHFIVSSPSNLVQWNQFSSRYRYHPSYTLTQTTNDRMSNPVANQTDIPNDHHYFLPLLSHSHYNSLIINDTTNIQRERDMFLTSSVDFPIITLQYQDSHILYPYLFKTSQTLNTSYQSVYTSSIHNQPIVKETINDVVIMTPSTTCDDHTLEVAQFQYSTESSYRHPSTGCCLLFPTLFKQQEITQSVQKSNTLCSLISIHTHPAIQLTSSHNPPQDNDTLAYQYVLLLKEIIHLISHTTPHDRLVIYSQQITELFCIIIHRHWNTEEMRCVYHDVLVLFQHHLTQYPMFLQEIIAQVNRRSMEHPSLRQFYKESIEPCVSSLTELKEMSLNSSMVSMDLHVNAMIYSRDQINDTTVELSSQLKKTSDIVINLCNHAPDTSFLGHDDPNPQQCIQDCMMKHLQIVSHDDDGLTAQKIYFFLKYNIDQHELLDLKQNSFLRRLLEWMTDMMRSFIIQYALHPIGDDTLFQDIIYNCLSIELLFVNKENIIIFIQRNQICDILLCLMDTHLYITQQSIKTATIICQYSNEIKQLFINHPKIPTVLTNLITTSNALILGMNVSMAYIWYIIDIRLEFIRCIGTNQTILSSTTLLMELLCTWSIIQKQLTYAEKDVTSNHVIQVLTSIKEVKISTLPSIYTQYHWMTVFCQSNSILNPFYIKMITTLHHSIYHYLIIDDFQEDLPVMMSSPLSNHAMISLSDSAAEHLDEVEDTLHSTIPSSQKSINQIFNSVHKKQHDIFEYDPIINDRINDHLLWRSLLFPSLIRTLRQIICQPLLQQINQMEFGTQLISIIKNWTLYPTVIPDTLFLIGQLTQMPHMNKFLGSIDSIVILQEFIKQLYKKNSAQECKMIGNACLTLSNLCMCYDNLLMFIHHNGPQIIIMVLKQRSLFNDTIGVNCASTLICNIAFNNIHTKQLFGNHGACQTLVQVLQDNNHFRKEFGIARNDICIFRAIGNLALHQHNVQQLILSNISTEFLTFLLNIKPNDQSITVEAFFKALSNIIIDLQYIHHFQSLLLPLLTFLQMYQTDQSEVYHWVFEIIGTLCHCPENSRQFIFNKGLSLILSIVKKYPCQMTLYSSSLFVFGYQTHDVQNTLMLLNEGIFDICIELLQAYTRGFFRQQQTNEFIITEYPVTDRLSFKSLYPDFIPNIPLCMRTIRCLQRMIIDRMFINQFIKRGGLYTMLQLMTSINLNKFLLLELLRLLFQLLATSTDTYEGQSLRSNNTVVSKKRLSITPFQGKETTVARLACALREDRQLKRLSSVQGKTKSLSISRMSTQPLDQTPRDYCRLGDRGWEILHLNDHTIHTMIRCIRVSLSSKEAFEDLGFCRIAIGLLTYFACEKKGFLSLYEPLDEWNSMTNFMMDDERKKLYFAQKSFDLTLFDKKKEDESELSFFKMKSFKFLRKSTLSLTNNSLDSIGSENQIIIDKTSIAMIIINAITEFKYTDKSLIYECLILINHMLLCAMTFEEKYVILQQQLYLVLKQLMFDTDIFFDSVSETLNLFQVVGIQSSNATLQTTAPYHYLVDIDFPLTLTGWNDNIYKDGVQSLPSDIKTFLRDGGKFEVYGIPFICDIDKKLKPKILFWRASYDLMHFQWIVSNPDNTEKFYSSYTNSLPVDRIKLIFPGVTDKVLVQAPMTIPTPVSNCLTIEAFNPNETSGMITMLLCAKNQKERDAMLHVFIVWRDAVAYGFN